MLITNSGPKYFRHVTVFCIEFWLKTECNFFALVLSTVLITFFNHNETEWRFVSERNVEAG
jgi:hypothetical protein